MKEARLTSKWARRLLAVALVAMLGAQAGAAGEAAPPDAARRARQEAIAQTLASINAQLQRYGNGRWETWAEKLKPFREALAKADVKAARDGWSFRDLDRKLLMLDHLDDRPEGRRPFDAITHFDRQLKARGIDLVVVIIPDKAAVYPDYLVPEVPCDGHISIQVKHLMRKLLESDVEVLDLHTVYRDHRARDGDKRPLYYGAGDTHWRNLATQLAAEQIAARLKRYDFVQKALAAGNPYVTQPFRREDGFKADDVLLVRTARGGGYQDVPDSPFVLTTDSYGYYNSHLNSHFTAQVARHVGLPLTLMFRMGLWGTMPQELAAADQKNGYLKGRRTIIWTFIARSFLESAWPLADLGPPPAGPEAK